MPHHVSRRVGTQRVVDLRAQVIPRCLWLDRPRHGLHRLKQLERHVLIPRDLVRHDARDVDRTQQEQRLFVLRLVDRVGVNLTVQKRGQVDQANGFRAGRVRRQGAPLGGGKPVLLSYLDCVAQGFNTVYGPDGVRDFFRTTTGWDTPILNDRAAPIYPRAQTLSDAETKLTDDNIKMIGAHVITPQ